MIVYKFYSTVGNGGSTASLNLDKLREYYETCNDSLSDALITFAQEEGKHWDDISPNAGDFDPYKTEISVSKDEYELLKREFPNAYGGDWEFISIGE